MYVYVYIDCLMIVRLDEHCHLFVQFPNTVFSRIQDPGLVLFDGSLGVYNSSKYGNRQWSIAEIFLFEIDRSDDNKQTELADHLLLTVGTQGASQLSALLGQVAHRRAQIGQQWLL